MSLTGRVIILGDWEGLRFLVNHPLPVQLLKFALGVGVSVSPLSITFCIWTCEASRFDSNSNRASRFEFESDVPIRFESDGPIRKFRIAAPAT